MVWEKENRIYSKLPLIYSYIMRKIDYKIWAEYIYSIVSEDLPVKPRILELAAGNCKLAKYLSEFYPLIIVSDISADMLKSSPGISLHKVCCDMTLLPFKNKFDLIYCAFDSINYLTSRKKILDLFKEINSILNTKGIFTFDVSLEKNSLIHTKQPDRTGLYKGIRFKQKSEYDKLKKIHKNTFHIKLNENEVYTEIHKQKIYSFETYFELLELSGLYVAECLDAFTYNKGNPGCERIQFIARKNNGNALL